MMAAPRQPQLRGELRRDELLKRYTTWRVGGAARQCYLPADVDDLAQFLRTFTPDQIDSFKVEGQWYVDDFGGIDQLVGQGGGQQPQAQPARPVQPVQPTYPQPSGSGSPDGGSAPIYQPRPSDMGSPAAPPMQGWGSPDG